MRRTYRYLSLSLLCGLFSSEAKAGTPDEYTIRYFENDEEGVSTGVQLQQTDFTNLLNIARCECGFSITAEVSGPQVMNPNERVQVHAGQRCNAFRDPTQIGDECVLVGESNAQLFISSPQSYPIDSIWLSSGVVDGTTENGIEATPIGACEGTGSGGIWMCTGNVSGEGCDVGDFFISGNKSDNATGGTGGSATPDPNDPNGSNSGTSGSISFDYAPPAGRPIDVTASPGDTAVAISWDFETNADINGYRILCAEADTGEDIGSSHAYTLSDINERPIGEIYYTMNNLCPEGRFSIPGVGDSANEDGDSETGGDDNEASDETGGLAFEENEELYPFGGESGTDTGDTSGGESDDGSDGDSTTGDEESGSDAADESDTSDTSDSGTDGGDTEESGESEGTGDGDSGDDGGTNTGTGITSLDWKYVCSPHISSQSKSARISGLENGKTYQFLVVAYDRAGNPIEVTNSDVVTAIPVKTNDFWEECENHPGVCGEGCSCSSASLDDRSSKIGMIATVTFLLFGFFGIYRRRRAA